MTPQAKQAMICGGCQREGCRLCWLYENRLDYRQHWDGKPHCKHRGPELRKEKCKLCGNRERFEPIFQCHVHGECSLKKWNYGTKFNPQVCSDCKDYDCD